jgi:hypothetical protein
MVSAESPLAARLDGFAALACGWVPEPTGGGPNTSPIGNAWGVAGGARSSGGVCIVIVAWPADEPSGTASAAISWCGAAGIP